MSFEVTEAMVQQYRSNIALVSQQRQSKLSPYVEHDVINAEFEYFDSIGPVEAQPKGGRHSDTPLMSTPHMRRRVTSSGWNWADMVDNADKLRMLADPTGPYTTNAVMAFNRRKDQVIIDAAWDTVWTGKEGKVPLQFPATQIINDGTVSTAAATTGLTIDKLLRAREMFWVNEIDESDPLFICCSAAQLIDLLNTTEVKNSDYNTVKALAQGQINSYMGFTFIRSERLPWDGNTRDVLIWSRSGLRLFTGQEITVRVTERPDKNYSTQIYVEMDLGALRTEEKKVIKCRCKEVAKTMTRGVETLLSCADKMNANCPDEGAKAAKTIKDSMPKEQK